jgi:hypothetical protein
MDNGLAPNGAKELDVLALFSSVREETLTQPRREHHVTFYKED